MEDDRDERAASRRRAIGWCLGLGLAAGSTVSTLTAQPIWIGVGLSVGLGVGAVLAGRD